MKNTRPGSGRILESAVDEGDLQASSGPTSEGQVGRALPSLQRKVRGGV